MSQVPAVTVSGSANAGASASSPEKKATSPASTSTPSSASGPAPAPKSRSCIKCRQRKVRCDKLAPCSTCRRANIPCVFASTDRPPRWARRLDDPGVGKVKDRLRTLENLVKDLSGQLEQAQAAAGSSNNSPGSSPRDRDAEHQRSTSPPTNASNVQQQFGRLVLQDANRSRYISSGFWSKINDELDGLKMDTRELAGDESDNSEDEESPGKSPSTQELDRAPSERHAFLFRHNLSPSAPDLREFHPLPSQIPFLLDLFSENVNVFAKIVHMPTITKMVRDLRSNDAALTPPNEALLFSIYYAAITSMDEDDVRHLFIIMTNFGASKTDLNLKYRLGLEHALARADFLNVADIVLVQAFAIFLALVRRHDSPRFVWMMTGLLIRMAQSLGLQRDGTHFEHLTPFEIEERRRVWSVVLMLDGRASEDQGMEFSIGTGSFDTKIPSNINDADLDPDSKQMPPERDGWTDMSISRVSFGFGELTRKIMDGLKDGAGGLEGQSRLLNEIYQTFEQGYLQYATEPGNIIFWVWVTIARLVKAKLTLIVYLPVLFSSPSEQFSDEIRTKLLVSAIEVAEYNHALNDEQACRQWRWVYQTYTHWHAIVYLAIEILRRPWSATIERSWVALHSSWLLPAQAAKDKNLHMWVPLRKMMAKARKHRDMEINRLRSDPQAATWLEMEDQKIPLPSSSGPFPSGSSVDIFRDRWRQLVAMPEGPVYSPQPSGVSSAGLTDTSMNAPYTNQPTATAFSAFTPADSNMTFQPTYFDTSGEQASQTMENTNIRNPEPTITTNAPSELALNQNTASSYDHFPTVPTDWSAGRSTGFGWLWADSDPSVDVFSSIDVDSMDINMDLNGDEVDWYNWVESAKGIETQWDAGLGGNGQS